MNSISVVVITKNRKQHLVRCLKSIAEQTIKPKEIIVIDSSQSVDTSLQDLQYYHDICFRYYYDKTYNIPAARNQGVKIATSEYILFIDDDCYIEKDTLNKVCQKLQKYPNYHFICGRIINVLVHNPYACLQQSYYDRWILENYVYQSRAEELHKQFLPGLDIFLIKTSIMKNITFSDSLPFGYDEDIAISKIISDQKIEGLFDPNLLASHSPRSSIFSLSKRCFMTAYANAYINHIYKINIHVYKNRLSFYDIFHILGKNSQQLSFFNKSIFWFTLGMMSLITRIGKLAYLLSKS